METKKCVDCGKDKPLSAFRRRNIRCHRCYGDRSRAHQRLKFLEAYGKKCACCSEDDPRFLSLDHVENDGNVERRKYSCQQLYGIARKEGYPSRFQILCYNCNFGKSTNGGICPHLDGITKEDAWKRLEAKLTYIGRKHVVIPDDTKFKSGFDARRMQLNRRNLKPCPFCGEQFGTNEMVRHKREKHAVAMREHQRKCLEFGRGDNSMSLIGLA